VLSDDGVRHYVEGIDLTRNARPAAEPGPRSRRRSARSLRGACPELGLRVMFMNCLVENAAMMHLARKQGLKIAVSGAEAEAFVRLPRADLTSLATEAIAEHLGLFDHAQKSYWVALQAQLPLRGI